MPNLPMPPHVPMVELRPSALNPRGVPEVVNRPEWVQWAERVRALQVQGVSGVILADGSVAMAANLPMGGYKLTGLGAGSGNGQSLRYEQVVGVYLLLAGGTMAGDIAMGANDISGAGDVGAATGTFTGAITGASSDMSGESEADHFEATGDPGGTPAANTLYKANICKGWVHFTLSGGTPTIQDSFNVSSITDHAVGDFSIVWDQDFGNATYAIAGVAAAHDVHLISFAAGSVRINTVRREDALGLGDASIVTVIAFGDQ